MARTAADITMPSDLRWPPAGTHLATCIQVERWISPKKKTPAVMLTWDTPDGQYHFEDPVFVTAKAIARLNLVAQHVCAMPPETELPDDNNDCASFLARYIMAHAKGRQSMVTVDAQEEFYMDKADGTKKSVMRHRVTFAGYEPVESPPAQTHFAPDPTFAGEDLPF